MTTLTSHHLLPPFAEGIKTAPLVTVSLAKLLAGDQDASDAFFTACKELGFFYMDMLGCELGEQIVREAEELNTLQKDFFKLPHHVKGEYGTDKLDQFYAYRYGELDGKDGDGVPLRREDYNLRKDDILGNCERLACHPMILRHQDLFRNYVLHCRAAVDCILSHLNAHLGLPAGTLADKHRIDHRSGDHVRFTQAPAGIPFDEARARRAEHTDFGSVTILFNWVGGLQIRMPNDNDGGGGGGSAAAEEWVYVRPVPGSCVVNLGDALVKFTAGLLRSNVHRVVPPAGAQAGLVRNSLVFFTRPEDNVVLRRLEGGVIDEQPVREAEGQEPELTAHEWIMARGTGKLPGVYTKKGFEPMEKDPESGGAGLGPGVGVSVAGAA